MKESGKASGKLSIFSGKQVIKSRGRSCQEKLTACAQNMQVFQRTRSQISVLGRLGRGEWGGQQEAMGI